MAEYRVTVTRANDDGTRRTIIYEFTSEYTIDTDLEEWIRVEIDPHLRITEAVVPDTEYPHNPANVTCPGPGIKCLCWDIDHS